MSLVWDDGPWWFSSCSFRRPRLSCDRDPLVPSYRPAVILASNPCWSRPLLWCLLVGSSVRWDSFHTAVNVLARAGRCDQALDVLKTMIGRSLKPNLSACHFFLTNCSKHKRGAAALEFLEIMRKVRGRGGGVESGFPRSRWLLYHAPQPCPDPHEDSPWSSSWARCKAPWSSTHMGYARGSTGDGDSVGGEVFPEGGAGLQSSARQSVSPNGTCSPCLVRGPINQPTVVEEFSMEYLYTFANFSGFFYPCAAIVPILLVSRGTTCCHTRVIASNIESRSPCGVCIDPQRVSAPLSSHRRMAWHHVRFSWLWFMGGRGGSVWNRTWRTLARARPLEVLLHPPSSPRGRECRYRANR